MMNVHTRVKVMVHCGMILAFSTASFADELYFGSPAPNFSAVMLRGEPLENFKEGKVYVIKFGGTLCRPCIKFIPEMNALHERYPEVTIVSVFCESTDTVETFLSGPGKAMRVRVAIDESRSMQKDWINSSGLSGIPLAFIIDRTGRLAWFGNPGDQFAEILGQVHDGKYDGRLEYMRMELKRNQQAESQKADDWAVKLNKLRSEAFNCETPEESIELIDKALPTFAGSPERIRVSMTKLDFYQKLPGSREQAYQHALSLAVEALNERNPHAYVEACEAMLSHCEFALPENVDSRLADLAMAVLLDKTAPTNHVKVSPDTAIDCQVDRLVAIANAHRIRGELSSGIHQLHEAITILRQREMKGKPKWWLARQKQWLSRLEAMLSEWKTQPRTRKVQ